MQTVEPAPASFAAIIDMWPSCAALARDMDISEIRVRKWRARDSIPGAHWQKLTEKAHARALADVTVERLAAIASARQVAA